MPSIRCGHYLFAVSDPYSAGHCLSENEAKALNALRAENIRNNVAVRVKQASADLRPGELLSQQAIADLTAFVTRYDAEYEFGSRKQYSRSSPIETAARAIAQSRVLAAARAAGQILSVEEIERETVRVSQQGEVQEEARRRVSEQEKVASAALESLL